VLIPDAISELVYFFQVERRTYQVSTPTTKAEEREQQAIDVDSEDGDKALKIPFAPGSSDSSEKYTYIYSVKTKVCSIVLVDLGSQITGVKKGPHEIEKLQLTETVVLQGIFDSTLTMGCDPVSFEVEVADLQSQADSLEIFSAFGKDMLSPLQILEPSQAAVHGSMKSNEEGGTEIEIRSAATSPLEYSFSMHNAALLSAILDSLSESLTATSESNQDEVHIHELSKAEAERIENLVSALENGAKDTSIIHQNSIGSVNSNSSSLSVESLPSTSTRKAITSRKIQVKLTMPKARFTVINDLQGLDEALFRVSVINFVAGGELKMPLTKTTSQKTTVDFYLNTSILADYFDSSVNLWSKLLTMPWEITLKVTRSPSRRFRSDRLSSAIDVESCPCHISFSQEFLVSLASATRMWSIYSVATTKSSNPETISGDSEVGDHSLSIKNSMAASAARNLLTSLPYAIENHCGVDAVFSIPGGSLNHRPCPHGSVQYFRFQPPKGNGFGGQRLYGQDVAFEKAITLMLEDSVIEIPHIDAMLTCPTLAHNLPGNRILLTHVAIEGKTTVSQ
jgi:vacuolar protein sorting-associated protein 13A/C